VLTFTPTAGYISGNLGTQATCHETASTFANGLCGYFAADRIFKVNGVLESACSGTATGTSASFNSIPAPRNGGYCFQASAGDTASAYFQVYGS
jgi:hypothetical protein